MGRMGQTRDNGTGKQCGSHVDYVVEGALPSNSLELGDLVTGGAPLRAGLVKIPIRASELLPRVTCSPREGWGGRADDVRWFDSLARWAPMVRVDQCHGKWGKSRDYPVYDDVLDYLREIPPDVMRLAGWYVEWCLEAQQRMKSLPARLRSELLSVKAEYPVLGKIFHQVQELRMERFAEDAVERLAEFSEDERPQVRQSAVAAASKLLEMRDKKLDREAASAPSTSVGGGFTVNVNIAQMLGDTSAVGVQGEIVDAKRGD